MYNPINLTMINADEESGKVVGEAPLTIDIGENRERVIGIIDSDVYRTIIYQYEGLQSMFNVKEHKSWIMNDIKGVSRYGSDDDPTPLDDIFTATQ